MKPSELQITRNSSTNIFNNNLVSTLQQIGSSEKADEFKTTFECKTPNPKSFKRGETLLVLGAEKYLDYSSSSSSVSNHDSPTKVQSYPSRPHLIMADRKVIPGTKNKLLFGTKFSNSRFLTEEDNKRETLK